MTTTALSLLAGAIVTVGLLVIVAAFRPAPGPDLVAALDVVSGRTSALDEQVDQTRVGAAVLGVISMVAVGLAIGVVRSTPALSVVAVAVGLPAVVMTLVEAATPETQWVALVSALLHAPFYFYVSYGMIRYLFHDDRVTTDELYATGAAFTVVAWGFAYVFVACRVIWPGSFVGAEGNETHAFFDLLFLSFTAGGIFFSVLLAAALMGLVFLSSGTGHDERIQDFSKDDD